MIVEDLFNLNFSLNQDGGETSSQQTNGGQGDLGTLPTTNLMVIDPSKDIDIDDTQFLNLVYKKIKEAKEVDTKTLKDIINTSKEPLYIIMAGSVGSGKSYFIDKHFADVTSIDVDDIKKDLGDTTGDKKVAKAVKILQDEVDKLLKGSESFIQQGTSANLQSTINKLKKAKEHNFKTVLIYVDGGDEEEIFKRIQQRVGNGGHGASISLDKIKKSKKFSKLTLNALSNNLGNADDIEISALNKAIDKTTKDIKKAQDLLDYFLIIE